MTDTTTQAFLSDWFGIIEKLTGAKVCGQPSDWSVDAMWLGGEMFILDNENETASVVRRDGINDVTELASYPLTAAGVDEMTEAIRKDVWKKSSPPDAYELSKEFRFAMAEVLDREELAEIDAKNAADAARGQHNTCWSHEFCDANEVMLTACSRFGWDPDAASQGDADVLNMAWDFAKAEGFSNV